MQLRDYQEQLKTDIYTQWDAGLRAVCAVSPTGSGKTVLMGSVALDKHTAFQPGCVIAHRVELVSQISMAMARFGIPHNIIAAKSTIAFCVAQHVRELGRKFYDARGMVTVAAVDTLNARHASLGQWFADQRWWMIDECHHLLANNKWGTAVSRMPQAIGLGVTATPVRADRKSLHVEQGGVFDAMVLGPTMRDLIDRGKLCDYRIFAPPASYEMTADDIGSTGDFKAANTKLKAVKSEIVGDVVSHYMKLTPGRRGITFTVDVAEAESVAEAFNAEGIPAIAVSAKTPDSVRQAAIDKFRRGVVLQLVNVDLFGEGFDVPAVEVVSMARPTMSYGLYVQQFGRALRILDGKERGIIIDHVGNVKRHGLPDAPRRWSLWSEARGRKKDDEEKPIPVTACTQCFTAYERIHKACPYCGHIETPEGRGRPDQVDGDLVELSPEVLAAMRADVDKIDGEPVIPYGATAVVEGSVRKRWRERQEAQGELRDGIARWAGVYRERGESDSVIMRRFFHRFGVDILSAQALSRPEAEALTTRIVSDSFS